MTILTISILSIGSKVLSETVSWLDWVRGLSDGESFALFVTCYFLVAIPLSLLFGDRIRNFIEEWKQANREMRQRRLIEASRVLAQSELERAAFFNQAWDKKEAAFELNKLRRELDYRNNPFEKRYMPDLSDEDIHQRIDYLEALEFDAKKKQPSLSLADRRIACRKLHDEAQQKELQELSNAFFDNEAARKQEVEATYNFWNNRKRNALQNIGRAEER